METSQIIEEIRELNLGYLLLAQQLLRDDKIAAMYRLGINQDVADIIARLSSSQLLKMAASNMLLCRFRFDDRLIAEMLSNSSRDQAGIPVSCSNTNGRTTSRSNYANLLS